MPLMCDDTSAINLPKNPIQYFRTKHIEIKYHFLGYHVQKGDIVLEFVSIEKNNLKISLQNPLVKINLSKLDMNLG